LQANHSKEYHNYEACKATRGQKRQNNDDIRDNSVSAKKQATVDAAFKLPLLPVPRKSQSEFEHQLVLMLAEDMQPLAMVERGGFQKFCKLLLPQYTLPSRRTLGRRLSNIYEVEKEKLIAELAKARWVSTTADIWSAHKRSFMGVTIHYVQSETLEMESSFLVCRRFKGAHTEKAIAKILYSIFSEFNIVSKIQNVVTDNAANFTKAFSLFQTTTDELDEGDNAAAGAEELIHVNVAELLQQINNDQDDNESDELITLPPHKNCSNHSLNLVASSDALSARGDKSYQRSYDRAMAKVQALSNAVSRSPKMNDTVQEITGKTFLKPTCTRWCSEYYSVARVVEIGFDKVVECQRALGQIPISQADITFLTAFVSVMKPVVNAMKLLEGEKKCYVGHLIPTIMGLEKKLATCSDPIVMPLVNALLKGLNERFGELINSREYKIATMLHPKFKLAFLPDNERLEHRQLLVSYVLPFNSSITTSGSMSAASTSSADETTSGNDDDDLYGFIRNMDSTSEGSVHDQVTGYLSSKSDEVSSLLAFPIVAEAFKKSNSTLPSSAAVERLFSAAAQVLTSRRCKLADETLDHLLFLRSRLITSD